MPKQSRIELGPGYQTAYREGRWYLQRSTLDGWVDVGEGSKQRGSQVEKWRRLELRRIHAARDALVASGKPCEHPAEYCGMYVTAYDDDKRDVHYPAQYQCGLCGEVVKAPIEGEK